VDRAYRACRSAGNDQEIQGREGARTSYGNGACCSRRVEYHRQKQWLAGQDSGIYPLSHFVFDDKEQPIMKAFFVQEMLEKGFLASNLFYSMFAHTKKHVAAYLTAADEVFGRIRQLKDAGKLRAALKGEPSAAGFKRIT